MVDVPSSRIDCDGTERIGGVVRRFIHVLRRQISNHMSIRAFSARRWRDGSLLDLVTITVTVFIDLGLERSNVLVKIIQGKFRQRGLGALVTSSRV